MATDRPTYDELKTICNDLQKRLSRHIVTQQTLINVRDSLDSELTRFKVIQSFNEKALRVTTLDEFGTTTVESIVEAFGVECSAWFKFNKNKNCLKVCAAFGFKKLEAEYPFNMDRMVANGLFNAKSGAIIEKTHFGKSFWASMGLSQVIFCPYYSYNTDPGGLILGAISLKNQVYYDEINKDMVPSFTVFTQQVIALLHNFKSRQIIQRQVEELEIANNDLQDKTEQLLIAQEQLAEVNKHLERKVNERTASLSASNEELKEITERLQREIIERKRMEEELLKVQKLESLGILAGGIAHDFNNLLTGILGNITLVKMKQKLDSEAFQMLDEAKKAALRSARLTKQLLTFSTGGAPIKKTIAIPKLLQDTAGFAVRGSNSMCEFSIPNDLWVVDVDKGQLSQVINNFVINAQQAMPEGGTIKVEAKNIVVDAKERLPLTVGKYVQISIEDQGVGIAEEHLRKIFDPYFTTKQQGSGLGLATSYSIMKKHDGYIFVESEVGSGATFYIYLPASAGKTMERKRRQNVKPVSGPGRILLMDDEEIVRNVGRDILRFIGYEAELARDGAEAIELHKVAMESGRPFDAVILDLTIPGGLGGRETIKRLIEIDPQLKGIVSSGYSDDPVMADFKEYGFKDSIAKPYQVEEFREVLQKVIMGKTR